MNTRLDRASSIPLFQQIAELIRYRIATGDLREGERLPSVRDAAEIWDVNMHTVRRAYQRLAADGLVEVRAPHAAKVRARPETHAPGGRKLDRFLDAVIRTAATEHSISPPALASLLCERARSATAPHDTVYVIECSERQATGHARELAQRWRVDARPWSLERADEPPPGPLVATYFHYNDVRVRWPHRLDEVHFAAIRPDPGIASRVPPPAGERRLTLRVCELDAPFAESVAADLSRLLPAASYRLVPEVVRSPGKRLARGDRAPLLFPPRVWHLLTDAERARGRAVEITYVFEPDELESLGRRYGWKRRHP